MQRFSKNFSNLPKRGRYDVVIVGAGPSGICAAIASSRAGAKTLLIERYGFPGGVATTACCPHLMGFAAAGGKQVVSGIADEFVRRLDRMGYAGLIKRPAFIPDKKPIGRRPITGYVVTSVDAIRIAANNMLKESRAIRLYYTALIDVVIKTGLVDSIIVDNADGLGIIKAKVFIDATGDANLIWRAGGKTRVAPIEDSMTKTILFMVGGVKGFHREKLGKIYKELYEKRKYPFKNQNHFMAIGTLNPGKILVNMTLTVGNALSASDLTMMDVELREQVFVCINWLKKYLPGFEKCYLVDSATSVGVRAGRSMVGLETITCRDLDSGTHVAEPVAIGHRNYGGHGVRRFLDKWAKSNPGTRGIPLKSLIPEDFKNVLAAGRCISAEPRAIGSFRLMANCMAIGQAAGVVAALSVKQRKIVPDVKYADIKKILLKQDVILE
ncbi:MAG: FAD-dependent oxidoreductase [Verrucomicrobia bacterium]|nr:FAD-dependent oxidoreductase [Verrucomicrobiota bacterium]MBU1735410.1 FAD-dependent oxidoreductase [Verrucomicrobiota bacterium]MBU1857435.1 FAD-dependent oxidoreductase [Verrucomicrobiota bacterium]